DGRCAVGVDLADPIDPDLRHRRTPPFPEWWNSRNEASLRLCYRPCPAQAASCSAAGSARTRRLTNLRGGFTAAAPATVIASPATPPTPNHGYVPPRSHIATTRN